MESKVGKTPEHLYVHVPFCPKICPYCSFYKEASDRNKTQAYLDAILTELARFGRVAPKTIFFGGGTPSALSVKQLKYLLSRMQSQLDLKHLTEWTLEMNPATVSLEKAELLRALGVNRISMGVQSWNDQTLRRLGRVHQAAQAERSYDIIRKAGFENVNLDLIFGVPGQNLEEWQETLQKTIALGPEHVSAYCLTYEEDTEFFVRHQRGEFLQDPAIDAEFFAVTMELLEAAGLEQYEISNYARSGRECRHNLGYWQGADYLGLGPSAFSTVENLRWQNVPDTARYVAGIQNDQPELSSTESISPAVRLSEKIAFGLRTRDGINLDLIKKPPPELAMLQSTGYLDRSTTQVRLTRQGRMVADTIAELLI